MIRAVLDTNVLASGIAGVRQAESPPGELVRRWRRRAYSLVVSDHLLGELERTLGRPYFATRITPLQTTRLLWTLRTQGELTPISVTVSGIATHPEDDLVLAAVETAQVDFLVTGDRKLQAMGRFAGAEIVSPSRFVEILEASLKPPADDE